ncbi:hypothetical protein K456DRAFT_796478 [Colletotrichum gloeosporioides 23]|nr:hypothetical protein K456DRAFT_796478 [Colletotrichum gloeosporioides 23]
MPLPSLSMTLAIQVAKTLADSRQRDLLPSQTGKTHRTTRTSRSLEFRLHAGLASWPLMSAWKEKPKPPWDADQTRRVYLVGRTADTRHSTEHLCGCVCRAALPAVVLLCWSSPQVPGAENTVRGSSEPCSGRPRAPKRNNHPAYSLFHLCNAT